jgi:hypothetical protein
MRCVLSALVVIVAALSLPVGSQSAQREGEEDSHETGLDDVRNERNRQPDTDHASGVRGASLDAIMAAVCGESVTGAKTRLLGIHEELVGQVWALAEQYCVLRDSSIRKPGDEVALKQQINEVVERAFAAGQEVRKAELNELRRQLLRGEKQYAARNHDKDDIIDRGVEELLAQALRWNRGVKEGALSDVNVDEEDQPDLEGVVLGRSAGYVEISLGQADGVQEGMQFRVFDDQVYLGRIHIIKLDARESVGRVEEDIVDMPMRRGDRVTSRQEPRPEGGVSGKPGAPSAVHQTQAPSAMVQIGGSSRPVEAHPGPRIAAEVWIREPKGATLLPQGEAEGAAAATRIPGRLPLTTGETMRATLSNIPDYNGVELSASIELRTVSELTKPFVDHNAIPFAIPREGIDHAISGNLVTIVVYLPRPENAEIALAGVATLVTTRLDPGADPLREAQKQGHVLGILRLGDRSPKSTKYFEKTEKMRFQY